MLCPWLLLPVLFAVPQAFSFPKHSADWTESSETPDCEELRSLWEYIRGTSQYQQLTNEIAVMPVHAQPSFHSILKALGNKSHLRKPNTQNANAVFSNYIDMTDPFSNDPLLVQPPNYLVLPTSQETPNQDVSGIFGEFHEQLQGSQSAPPDQKAESEALELGPPSASMTSGSDKNRDTDFYIPQWGLPEEVDTFGSFVDFDLGSSKLAMTRTPKGDAGKWSDIAQLKSEKSSQGTCDALMNSDCTITKQCVCVGWKKLACIEGKCIKYDQKNDIGRKFGTWHDRPIPLSQLKLMSRLRKRRYRSIFM